MTGDAAGADGRGDAGEPGRAVAGPLVPPWLWVWLIGDLAVLIPAEIGNERYLFALYTGHGDVSARLTAGTPYKLLTLFALVAALTYAVLAVGAVAALFPQLRGRWVERRFRLADDDRPVIAEMQCFIGRYDPSVRLRVTIRAGQMARIYPVGWRAARIAVFLPLTVLWHRDRQAAEAILLHEVAHHRHGDQLVVGLGSPFVWLIRIWVPVFGLLVLSPIAVYAALGGGLLAQAVGGQGALQLVQPAELLILPVTALWLAELNADELTARILGHGPLQDALRATAPTRASISARLLALLSHPPRRLRLRCAAGRPASKIALLAAWPAALVAQLMVLIVGALIAELLVSQPSRQTGTDLLAGIRLFLLSNRILIIVVIILLLLWPVLSRPWDQLWSVRHESVRHESDQRESVRHESGRRQPWPPYLAAAPPPSCSLFPTPRCQPASPAPRKPPRQAFASISPPGTAAAA